MAIQFLPHKKGPTALAELYSAMQANYKGWVERHNGQRNRGMEDRIDTMKERLFHSIQYASKRSAHKRPQVTPNILQPRYALPEGQKPPPPPGPPPKHYLLIAIEAAAQAQEEEDTFSHSPNADSLGQLPVAAPGLSNMALEFHASAAVEKQRKAFDIDPKTGYATLPIPEGREASADSSFSVPEFQNEQYQTLPNTTAGYVSLPQEALDNSQHYQSLPGNATGDYQSLPSNAAGDYQSLPSNAAGEYQSLPSNAAGDYQSLPSNAAGDYQSLPSNAAGDYQSLPSDAAGDYQSLPGNAAGDYQSLPGNAAGDYQSLPSDAVGDYQSLPSNAAGDYQSLPSHAGSSEPQPITRGYSSGEAQEETKYEPITRGYSSDVQEETKYEPITQGRPSEDAQKEAASESKSKVYTYSEVQPSGEYGNVGLKRAESEDNIIGPAEPITRGYSSDVQEETKYEPITQGRPSEDAQKESASESKSKVYTYSEVQPSVEYGNVGLKRAESEDNIIGPAEPITRGYSSDVQEETKYEPITQGRPSEDAQKEAASESKSKVYTYSEVQQSGEYGNVGLKRAESEDNIIGPAEPITRGYSSDDAEQESASESKSKVYSYSDSAHEAIDLQDKTTVELAELLPTPPGIDNDANQSPTVDTKAQEAVGKDYDQPSQDGAEATQGGEQKQATQYEGMPESNWCDGRSAKVAEADHNKDPIIKKSVQALKSLATSAWKAMRDKLRGGKEALDSPEQEQDNSNDNTPRPGF